MKRDLLFELGCEELPPKALPRLAEALQQGVVEGLQRAGVNYGEVVRYATPRRLALLLRDLDEEQPDQQVERRGPALTAAFDDNGEPTRAASGFARSCGVEVDQLETLRSDKGAWLVFRSAQRGQPVAELLPAIIAQALDRLPIPKRMRWGDRQAEFVRPVHWLVLLFGDAVIDCQLLDVAAGRTTYGHRFHHPEPITLERADSYAAQLESEGRVMVDFVTRREAIRAQVLEAANRLQGEAIIDPALLDEVTGLVEWPVAVVGNFEQRFLQVPAEALISAMQGHQKYFPLRSSAGALLPHFITISNIESREPDRVREGNERVIRPRLADADFFWQQDRRQPLAARLDALATVVFQQRLGTLRDKAQRVSQLAATIAPLAGGDATLAARAGLLSKSDLLTEMVGEFPELQGIMGRYYAAADGEAAAVAIAIDEQYQPRFAGDKLPTTPAGQALALAERIDTLVGIFGIGQLPSGDKDPFALRRAALGVLRIALERGLDLDLPALLAQSAAIYRDRGVALDSGAEQQLLDFILERLRHLCGERGYRHDTIDAVLATAPANPRDAEQRMEAVESFRKRAEAESLAAANKRIHNILRKSSEPLPATIDSAQLQEAAEQQLAAQIAALSSEVAPLFAERDYNGALLKLAALREPVDHFFDQVMVMADDVALRHNRLALLAQLQGLFLQVADLSRLQG